MSKYCLPLLQITIKHVIVNTQKIKKYSKRSALFAVCGTKCCVQSVQLLLNFTTPRGQIAQIVAGNYCVRYSLKQIYSGDKWLRSPIGLNNHMSVWAFWAVSHAHVHIPTSQQLIYVHVYPVKPLSPKTAGKQPWFSHTCGVVVIMAECHVGVIKHAIV